MNAPDRLVPIRTDPVVRICDSGGSVVGAGVLLGTDRIGTCAHVIAEALTADPRGGRPDGVVTVEFVLGEDGGGPPVTRQASVERWEPIARDGTGDVAICRLDEPTPDRIRMPPVARVDHLWGERFRLLGFPSGLEDGVWVEGRFRGRQGSRWVQMQTAPSESRIGPGFSGSPVWHERTGCVVGVTVAVDTESAGAYLIPIDQVLGLDPQLLPNPYRGLAPFGAENAEFFFGRDTELAQLDAAVVEHALVAVTGPSGSGKSSLVLAGLLPLLDDAGVATVKVRARAGLTRDQLLPPGADRRTVLFIDQFEELLADDPEAADALVDLLVEVTSGNLDDESDVRAVLTAITPPWEPRSERLRDRPTAAVLVGPMKRDQLRQVIVGPGLRAPGLEFDTGLVERILDDTGTEPGRLALVQFLLARLWELRRGGTIGVAAYDAAGGVGGAIAQHAESVAGSVADVEQVYGLFSRFAAVDDDGRLVRRPVRRGDLPDHLAGAVSQLVGARLLVSGRDGEGVEVLELAHQALLDNWPRMRERLASDRDFLAWRGRLLARLRRWEIRGRDDAVLLSGPALTEAERWLRERADDVPAAAGEFVSRGVRRRAHRTRRRRATVCLAVAVAVVGGSLAVVSHERGARIAEQNRTALAGSLAAASDARALDDPAGAAQLALAARRADPNAAPARTALARSYLALRDVAAVSQDPTGQPVTQFTLSLDGRTMLQHHPTGATVVRYPAAERPERWDVPSAEAGIDLLLSPDGGRLVGVRPDGTVTTWDIAARTGPEPLTVRAPGRRGVSFAVSPDGRRLVVLDTANSRAAADFAVWDLSTRSRIGAGTTGLPAQEVDQVWLTADPDHLLVRRQPPAATAADAPAPQRASGGLQRAELAVLSLTDGRTVRTFADGSAVAELGGLAVSCIDATPGRDGAPAALTVMDTDTGREINRIPFGRNDSPCSPFTLKLTADRRHVVRGLSTVGTDAVRSGVEDEVVVTGLRTGNSHRTTVPVSSTAQPGGGAALVDVGLDNQLAVLAPDDGPPEVLATRGSSILRLRPPGRDWPAERGLLGRAVASDDDRLTAIRDYGWTTVLDSRTGVEYARLAPASPSPELRVEGMGWFGGELLLVTRDSATSPWVVRGFRAPTWAPLDPLTAGPANRLGVTVGPNRLVTVGDGVLTAWDTATRRRVVGPLSLYPGTGPDGGRVGGMWERPGHDGQFAVQAPSGDLDLWNVTTRTRTASLPLRTGAAIAESDLAFDATGNRLALLTDDGSIEVWDVPTGVRDGEPIPAGTAEALIGFAADGRLITRSGIGVDSLDFWDVDRRHKEGTFVLDRLGVRPAASLTVDRRSVAFETAGTMPFRLATSPDDWAATLCSAMDREFTPAESAALPPDADRNRPCAP